MAKLHFFYSTMNAGKSTSLLQSNHNYRETGLDTMIFLPNETSKLSKGKIVSRIGLQAKAIIANKDFNFASYVIEHKTEKLSCILIDEAQFLTKKQVRELGHIADKLNLPVMCYGIRTDFRGELFEGSSELLALADNFIELKTICSYCVNKATMVVRRNDGGKVVTEGTKVVVGGNDIYTSVCRNHFRELTKLV
ncbi:thymidine kinase [Gammaproteobacteria bacterium]|jgi:thymidine kinase|nr:thymidine kinase [Gammaproteobacteria bacterium]MDB2704724.1 thymidine kinase [Gammaproteobacteria bacterium]MDC3410888.1 thymidine kinase [Gammaproteobacteria bacterium]